MYVDRDKPLQMYNPDNGETWRGGPMCIVRRMYNSEQLKRTPLKELQRASPNPLR